MKIPAKVVIELDPSTIPPGPPGPAGPYGGALRQRKFQRCALWPEIPTALTPTGCALTITPSADGRVFFRATGVAGHNQPFENIVYFSVLRDEVPVLLPTGVQGLFVSRIRNADDVQAFIVEYEETPGVTVPITYELAMRAAQGAASLGRRPVDGALKIETAITLEEYAP